MIVICWKEKIVLVGKDHVGGRRPSLCRKIIVVGKDNAVLQDDEECRNVVFAPKKIFFIKLPPVRPFAT